MLTRSHSNHYWSLIDFNNIKKSYIYILTSLYMPQIYPVKGQNTALLNGKRVGPWDAFRWCWQPVLSSIMVCSGMERSSSSIFVMWEWSMEDGNTCLLVCLLTRPHHVRESRWFNVTDSLI